MANSIRMDVHKVDDWEATVSHICQIAKSFFDINVEHLVVEIAPFRKERTDQQNRALFGHAYEILEEETGNSKANLHNLFCGEFFGWKVVDVLGQKKREPVRTTTTDENGKRSVMPAAQFIKFYDLVVRMSAEYGIVIPDPDPQWRKHLVDEDKARETA